MAEPSASSRVLSYTGTSAAAGTIIGAVKATWIGAPSAGDGKALPALRNTGLIMGRYGVLYAFIFGAFSVGEVTLERMRGNKDLWNGVGGGFTGGAAYGAAMQSLSLGFGSGAMLATVSAMCDLSGGSFQQGPGIDDGQTPRKLDAKW